jgi:uncharacterized radical SAM superfamily Fe-S cluster-containing enzyme
VSITSEQRLPEHLFYERTRSLCPQCRRLVEAQVFIRDSAVFLRKNCPEHGWHEALISSDAAWYLDSLRYNKPGAIPGKFATEVARGCPSDCGICPEHQQHTCIGLIEITTRCNLSCPTCFADAGEGYDLSVAQVESILKRLLETEDQPEIVQLSGGEPTIHPEILDIIEAVMKRDIRHVMLNTNGLRLAQDSEFVHRLAQYKPTIYLQFDSLIDERHRLLRGANLNRIKQQALDNLAEAGLYAILVPTIVHGVNDTEIGDILKYGLKHPAVLGINYQPVTFTGRCLSDIDPLQRTTVPDVIHALETQTDGLFRVGDFRPVPCPYPTCSACTYALVHEGQVIPIPRILNVDDYLDYATNRSVPDISLELQSRLEDLWSMAALIGSDRTGAALACVACNSKVPLPAGFDLSPEHFFIIQIHGFMDEHSFDLNRLMKCCVHELLPDGRAVPLCAYNNLGYREQMKQQEVSHRATG